MPSLRAASSPSSCRERRLRHFAVDAFLHSGITLRTAMDAAPRIPHFTFFIFFSGI